MSGICGIIHFDGVPTRQETLRALIEAAEHRGPDGISTWRDGSVGLAHLALNVTPESEREDQPLVNREAGHVLVADARVDNRDALISALRGTLRTDVPTDADLILAAYRKWGLDCAEHLIGDFAFAIWDGRERRLFAARDAMAMRPFYYRIEEDRLLFGSEVKQILAAPEVPMEIFEPMVAAYLQGRFDPLDWTFYEGIKQLEPSHALLVEADGSHRTWRYWDIDPDNRIRYDNEQDYVEHFRELFAEAVRCRLRSTKPIGLLLSGGLDSGSIASMAGYLQESEEGLSPIQAYSWAFDELPECDERHISDIIVNHYNLPSADVPADHRWPLKDYPKIGPDRDEPYLGVYQSLLEHSCTQAREEGCKQVMTGERGDWVNGFWVDDVAGLFFDLHWRRLWKELRRRSKNQNISPWQTAKEHAIKPVLRDWGYLDLLRHVCRSVRISRAQTSSDSQPSYPPWVRDSFAEQIGLSEIIQDEERSFQRRKAFRDRYLLIFESIATNRWIAHKNRTMARLEVQFVDPWSDRRIAEYILGVPQHIVHLPTQRKRLVRKAMEGIVPEQARQQMDKIEPIALFDRGLRKREKKKVMDLTQDTRLEKRGYIDEDTLHKACYSFVNGHTPPADIWWPLVLEAWLRRHW